MFTTPLPRDKFDQGLTFDRFVDEAAREGQDAPWRDRHARLKLDADQRRLVESFTRVMHVVCLTGPWCGDCALQGAAMQRISQANPECVRLRFLNRDLHAELQTKAPVNAGFRVPMTFFMAEDFAPVSVIGDRTLSRYRSMALKSLGDASPVLAPPPADPLGAVLGEVLDEFERVHLLLRLSGRLRQHHGD